MVGDAHVPLLGLMLTCDKSLAHNVALWSTSLIAKLNPFFIPFWCFMASNALTILRGCIITFGQYQYMFLVVSIREKYLYFVYTYVRLDGRFGEQYFVDGRSLGYLLPNPTIKSKHVLSDITQ
jgi:hypothetical protein